MAKLQRASLRNPVKVEVSTKYQTVDKLLQYYIFIPAKYKVKLLGRWKVLVINLLVISACRGFILILHLISMTLVSPLLVFGSFGIMPKSPIQSCFAWRQRHCYLCTLLLVIGLNIDISYLVHICTYFPCVYTSNI